jgi:hypothetical protein
VWRNSKRTANELSNFILEFLERHPKSNASLNLENIFYFGAEEENPLRLVNIGRESKRIDSLDHPLVRMLAGEKFNSHSFSVYEQRFPHLLEILKKIDSLSVYEQSFPHLLEILGKIGEELPKEVIMKLKHSDWFKQRVFIKRILIPEIQDCTVNHGVDIPPRLVPHHGIGIDMSMSVSQNIVPEIQYCTVNRGVDIPPRLVPHHGIGIDMPVIHNIDTNIEGTNLFVFPIDSSERFLQEFAKHFHPKVKDGGAIALNSWEYTKVGPSEVNL